MYQHYLICETRGAIRAVNIANMLPRYQQQKQQIGSLGWDTNQKQTPVNSSFYFRYHVFYPFFLCPHLIVCFLYQLLHCLYCCFSIGQTFTFHGTQRATPGFRTCASHPIWYGSQTSSSTTGRLYSQPFALFCCLVPSHFVSSSLPLNITSIIAFFHQILVS